MVAASSLVDPSAITASMGTFTVEVLLAFALAILTSLAALASLAVLTSLAALTSLVDLASSAVPSSVKEQATTSTLVVAMMNRSRLHQGFIRCQLNFT